MMQSLKLLILSLAICSIGSAGVITFEEGTNGAVIGGFYAGQGVTFSAAFFDSFSCFGSCAGFGSMHMAAAGYMPKAETPIVITFSSPMTFVSIYGQNVGGNGARMDAYDAEVAGNLLGFDQDTSVASGAGADNNPLLEISAAGMRRVVLYQPLSNETEGLLFDSLSFTPDGASDVPEPSTWLLCGAGLAALAYRRLRV